MPEIIILSICLMVFSPPIISGMFARSQGRRFWVWFFIGCVLPFIAVIIIFLLPEVHKELPAPPAEK
ncbi:hypothetical protein BH11BAC2_BH11BAC2_19840 [soil metagenome]